MRWIVLLFILYVGKIESQTQKPIFRYPHVSDKEIVFGYANDIWVVSKNGGLSRKLSSPPGPENWPRFSPDGQLIAFTGNYSGNENMYVIQVFGGLPRQLTYHSMSERVQGWFPDGQHILFSSSMKSGKQRFSQFYKIHKDGGLPEKLPIAHAEFGSISPDGKQIAFTDKTRAFRTWKRYRGGTAPDIILFNLETYETKRITNSSANDEFPMWIGNDIYYLSDQGEELRFNIWKYNTKTEKHTQITFFKDKDIHFPSAGKTEIVFEAAGDIYLMNCADDTFKKIDIQVVSDFDAQRQRNQEVSDLISNIDFAPDGSRVILEARGDIFNVPVKNGATYNISRSSGSAERYPTWSPDGSKIAYWSDQNGEYNLVINNLQTGAIQSYNHFKDGYRYSLYWSPDNKHLAFIDQAMQVQLISLDKPNPVMISKQLQYMHFASSNFSVNWSSDSRWLVFPQQLESGLNGLNLYNVETAKSRLISGGLYSFTDASFDPEGYYLYVVIANHFSPTYSGFDNSFVYTNNRQIGAFTLRDTIKSPFYPENDTVSISKNEESKKEEESSKADGEKDKEKNKEKDKSKDVKK